MVCAVCYTRKTCEKWQWKSEAEYKVELKRTVSSSYTKFCCERMKKVSFRQEYWNKFGIYAVLVPKHVKSLQFWMKKLEKPELQGDNQWKNYQKKLKKY